MIVSNLRNKLAQSLKRPSMHGPMRFTPQLQCFSTNYSADDNMEAMDDIFKQMSGVVLDPRIIQQKEDVVYIKNPKEDWAFNKVLNFQNNKVSAITICLQNQQAIALLLNKTTGVQDAEFVDQSDHLKVKLGWGQTQTAIGEIIDEAGNERFSETEIDLVAKLPKANMNRKIISEQLYSGHMRLDLGRPMAKGNFIVFKGPSKRGKTTLAQNTIKQFLEESDEHRAIYIGLTKNTGQQMFQSLSEDCKKRAMAIGTDQVKGSDADFLLAPRAAIHASSQLDKVLVVFDDVILHKFKEKMVYDLASQPFASVNIINELMEQTGCFKNGRVVSTIVIADTESNQLQFQKDEDALLVHIESVADQVIEFDDDQHKRRLGASLPILPTKPGQKMPHQAVFLRPFVYALCNEFQALTDNIDKAYVQHTGKSLMNISEDPWDNYLYYDSKHVLPIVSHKEDMPIEKQVLLAIFIQKSVENETISQYKVQGSKLVKALVDFVNNEFDYVSATNYDDADDEDMDDLLTANKSKGTNLLEQLRECCESRGDLQRPETVQTVSEVDRCLKMFFLHMQMSGQLKEYKEDYFA